MTPGRRQGLGRGPRLLAILVVATGALGACATAPRAPGILAIPGKGYQVEVPAGWERVPSDADLALRRRGAEDGLLVHGTCQGQAPRRPLAVLARHLRFGLREIDALEQESVVVAGQPAWRAHFLGRLDGQRVEVTAVTVKGPRCVYDLAAVGPAREAPDPALVQVFDHLVGSLSLTEPHP